MISQYGPPPLPISLFKRMKIKFRYFIEAMSWSAAHNYYDHAAGHNLIDYATLAGRYIHDMNQQDRQIQQLIFIRNDLALSSEELVAIGAFTSQRVITTCHSHPYIAEWIELTNYYRKVYLVDSEQKLDDLIHLARANFLLTSVVSDTRVLAISIGPAPLDLLTPMIGYLKQDEKDIGTPAS